MFIIWKISVSNSSVSSLYIKRVIILIFFLLTITFLNWGVFIICILFIFLNFLFIQLIAFQTKKLGIKLLFVKRKSHLDSLFKIFIKGSWIRGVFPVLLLFIFSFIYSIIWGEHHAFPLQQTLATTRIFCS